MTIILFIAALAIFIALFDEFDKALSIVVGLFLLAVIFGVISC